MNIKLKCYHCQQSPDVLILLQPQNVRKHICIKCFAVRHPETSRETLESLLDEEQKQEIVNSDSLKSIITSYNQGGIYGETIY